MGNHTIKVSTDALDLISKTLSQTTNKIEDASSALAGVWLSGANGANSETNSSCSLRVRGSGIPGSSVGTALKDYKNALSWYAEYVSRLSRNVSKVKALFEESDSSMINMISDNSEKALELDEVLLKALGKAGYFGSLASGALLLRDLSTKNIIKFTAGAANTTAKWYKSNRNLNIVARSSKEFANELRYKKLFGLDKYFKSGELSRDSSKLRAYNANASTKWSQALKKPGTWIVAGIGSAFDNYSDYKSGAITSDRAVVEWASETAGNVVLTTGATAVAGAGLAAVGFAGAPVIVVGAVATVVVMAVDAKWADTIGKAVGRKDKDEGMVETLGWAVGEGYDFVKGLDLFGKTGAIKAYANGGGFGGSRF